MLQFAACEWMMMMGFEKKRELSWILISILNLLKSHLSFSLQAQMPSIRNNQSISSGLNIRPLSL